MEYESLRPLNGIYSVFTIISSFVQFMDWVKRTLKNNIKNYQLSREVGNCEKN